MNETKLNRAHRKLIKIFIGTLLVLTANFGYAQKVTPNSNVREMAKKLFEAEDFENLDRLSLQYLSSHEKIPNGMWKLSELYDGIDSAMSTPPNINTYAEIDKHWNSIQKRLDRWLKKTPSSMMANTLKSIAYTNQGWSYRGTGFSSSVNQDAWVLFNEFIQKAKLNLLSVKSFATKDPNWYCAMFVIAKVEGWSDEQFFELLNEGIAKHPNYYQIYNYASSRFLPQWGGSIDDVERFAKLSAENSTTEEGRSFYARVLWSAYQSHLPASFIKNKNIWLLMKSSFDELVNMYPDPWNLYAYARFSCMAGDRENLKRVIGLIGPAAEIDRVAGPPLNPWGKDFFLKCVAWIDAPL